MIPKVKRPAFLLLGILLVALIVRAVTVNISNSPNLPSWEPRMTIDSAGNLYVVWIEVYQGTTGDIFFSRYDAAGAAWSAPVNISESGQVRMGARSAGIAIDGSNRVATVWGEGDTCKLRVYESGSWGSVVDVGSANVVDSPRVAAGSNGDVYVIWSSYTNGDIFSRARAGGVFEDVQRMNTSGRRSKVADIGAGPNSVYAVWMQKGASDYQIAYSRRDRGAYAGWSTPTDIYTDGAAQIYPCVIVDSSDVAHAIWAEEIVEAARTMKYSSNGGAGWSAARSISDETTLHFPALYSRGGKVYTCWQTGAWGNGFGITYNILSGGSWSGQIIAPAPGGLTYVDIVVDASGLLYFVSESSGDIYQIGRAHV
jgi:hypothetical protein